MMRSMFSGITGLKNFQVQMDVLSNNISNVNTTGFKASRVTFETTLLQTIKGSKAPDDRTGGTNPAQIGLGSKVASIDKMMSQGSFQNTGKKTDLAISGDGFFILSDGTSNYYTRNGGIAPDTSGVLVSPSTGLKVQGWGSKIDTKTGQRVVDTNDPIGDIKISAGLVMPAKQSTYMKLAHNLNANVGLQETTFVTKTSLGENLPVKMTFEKNLQSEYKDRIVYNWKAEISDSAKASNYGLVTNEESYLSGMVELDSNGNVVNWMQNLSTSAGTDIKMSAFDIRGDLKSITTPTYLAASTVPAAAAGDLKTSLTVSGKTATDTAATYKISNVTYGGSGVQALSIKKSGIYYKIEVTDSLGELHTYTKQVVDSTGLTFKNTFTGAGITIDGKDLKITFGAADATATPPISALADTDTLTDQEFFIRSTYDTTTIGTNNGNASFVGGIKLVDTTTNSEVYYNPKDISILTDASNNMIVKLKDKNGQLLTFTSTAKTVTDFNNAMSSGLTFGNYKITGLSLTGIEGSSTFTASQSKSVCSIRNIIQPPSGGAIKFLDVSNPQNFVVAGYSSPSFTVPSITYDSLGRAYNIYTTFTKIKENTWQWKAQMADGSPVYGMNSDGNPLQVNGQDVQAEGIIAFDGNGAIAATNWRVDEKGDVDFNSNDSNNGAYGFWFDPNQAGSALNPAINPPSVAGAGRVKIEIKFNELTQFASPHSAAITEQDGNAEGTLETYAINENGQIIGTFTNGSSDKLGQVSLAVFNNSAGLIESGNSLYIQSANSGLAQIGTCGVGGRGTLIPGALEMSNVDLAEEFAQMIIAQRGFQSAARIISSADQILQELVNIKR